MATSMTAWKRLLLLCAVTALLESAVAVDQACFGTRNALHCSQHHLWCHEGTISIIWALRGFKDGGTWCDAESENCDYKKACCRYNQRRDCLEYYSYEAVSSLRTECENKTNCTYTVPEANNGNCKHYEDTSGYSMVEYLCSPGSSILDFRDSTPKTGERMALRYVKSDDTNNYVCRVEAEDCTNQTVDITMIKAPNNNTLLYGPCTTVGVDGEKWMKCDSDSVSFASHILQTPFDVMLKVFPNNSVNEIWTRLQANNSLRVACMQWTDNYTFPQCSPPSTTWKSGTPPFHTASTTADSTERPDKSTTADVQSLATSTAVSGYSPEVTEETMYLSAGNTATTAAVVGVVVGGVLVVGLVGVVVGTLLFLKRRSSPGKTFSVPCFKRRSPGATKAERAESQPMPAQPTSLPVYDDSAVTISDEAGDRDPDSDYNHLGQKPTSSASRDVTYGHLADGNDVTDYGYENVTRGKPAARSGDVINNVYNTAGSTTRGSSVEGIYHTVGTKIRPDITNMVYDTPKSARTAGSGETEVYDVTGDDAGSQYELARSVT